ncbi:Cof-type HAD-IIB family hydrolase [Levilactobacillus suantsaiihabitans]|uniref:HAD family phosphatase n=1 Tax=Levilactobacillus suantsaiihabitans TaxID=2487722 RepID=A0A4Z0J617_9LACO|nr:Cof-type HAD-IIB family hydrolase [Levilactobacillus suantsaiihabitans]TGD17928.1 HAD family phosphatase [Levilactobacillus suantsaiihabitans]
MIQHVFSDMDGTLLNSHGELSDTTIAAVKGSSVPVTLVSARAPLEMARAIAQLGLTAPQVAFNGGLIFQPQTGDVRLREALPAAASQALLTTIERDFPSVSVSAYDQTTWYAHRIDAGILHEQVLTHQSPVVVPGPLATLARTRQFLKIMLIGGDAAVMTTLQRTLTQLNLPVSIKQSGQEYLEITSERAQKSRGIAAILRQRGISAQAAAAFGDGHNDLPMLQTVGLPIVMGNATPEIQAAGRYVTKTNDENGVAYGLTHLLTTG